MKEVPDLTSHEWIDFMKHPAVAHLKEIMDERLEMWRTSLEGMLDMQETSFVRGQCESIRWIYEIFTNYESVLKLLEEKKEQEEKEKENADT